MGQQVSVDTFASSRDSDGNKYWTSFDPYPFKVGCRKLVYMGILNGYGPLSGQKCVVKTIRNGAISEQDWQLEDKRAKIARYLARKYNVMMPRGERQITFNCPIMAEIDTMSDCLCINDILGKPKKKWGDAESVSIELYLKGKYEDFEYGWVDKSELLVPEAFSHFTWCCSEGKMLVSNLQGVKTRLAYHFTGPTIHSEAREFGTSDGGYDGIKSFFRLHKCNAICKNWPRLGDGTSLQGWEERSLAQHRYPTAPPLSQSVPLTPPPYAELPEPYRRTPPNVRHQYPNRAPMPPVSDSQEIFPWDRRRNSEFENPDTTTLNQQSPESCPPMRYRHGDGFMLDWREEFVNYGMMQSPQQYNDESPNYHDALGMQLMWIVKQMSYSIYSQPPPAYCACAHRNNANAQISAYANSRHVRAVEGGHNNLTRETKSLLPPPYDDGNDDTECELVTYV